MLLQGSWTIGVTTTPLLLFFFFSFPFNEQLYERYLLVASFLLLLFTVVERHALVTLPCLGLLQKTIPNHENPSLGWPANS